MERLLIKDMITSPSAYRAVPPKDSPITSGSLTSLSTAGKYSTESLAFS
jgi:hypothetical protein